MPKIDDALSLLLEQRVQPLWLGLRTVRTQDGCLAERRLRTFVDDEYRQVVCHRKHRSACRGKPQLRPLSLAYSRGL